MGLVQIISPASESLVGFFYFLLLVLEKIFCIIDFTNLITFKPYKPMWNIVFVWAGGTGMSGLALMLFDLWYHNIVAIDAVESLLMMKNKGEGS
jgi:hypothetical protein